MAEEQNSPSQSAIQDLIAKGVIASADDINKGVDLGGLLSHDCKPLQQAAARGDSEVVELLIIAKANINDRSACSSALSSAAAGGKDDIVKMLIDAKADMEQKMGVTPFWKPITIAAARGNFNVVALLAQSGAMIEAGVIHEAVFRGDNATVRLLAEAKADVQAPGQCDHDLTHNECQSGTPVKLARGNPEIIKTLVEAKADASGMAVVRNPDEYEAEDLAPTAAETLAQPTLFTGEGNSLGGSSSGTAVVVKVEAASIQADPSKPTTKVKIRFHDGQKKDLELNQDHTVGDLRSFCSQCADGKPMQIMGGFPPKEMADDSLTLKDAALCGAMVTVKPK